jgi:hypothetical protein
MSGKPLAQQYFLDVAIVRADELVAKEFVAKLFAEQLDHPCLGLTLNLSYAGQSHDKDFSLQEQPQVS